MTLNGTNDIAKLYNSATVFALSSTDTIEVAGTGSVVGVTGRGNIPFDAGASASVANNVNTITMGQGSSATVSGTNDSFVFRPSFGHDTIIGYIASGTTADSISIDHTEFADWAHLLAASTQSGGDVLITANTNDSLLLKNTTLASLQSSQFHFT